MMMMTLVATFALVLAAAGAAYGQPSPVLAAGIGFGEQRVAISRTLSRVRLEDSARTRTQAIYVVAVYRKGRAGGLFANPPRPVFGPLKKLQATPHRGEVCP